MNIKHYLLQILLSWYTERYRCEQINQEIIRKPAAYWLPYQFRTWVSNAGYYSAWAQSRSCRTFSHIVSGMDFYLFIFFFYYFFFYFIKTPKIGEIHVQYMNNINIIW